MKTVEQAGNDAQYMLPLVVVGYGYRSSLSVSVKATITSSGY